MRVLHVYKTYYPETVGGVEKLIQGLSVASARLGVDNRLMTTTKSKQPYSKPHESNLKLPIDYYPEICHISSTPFSVAMWQAFQEQIKWADIIHYHYPWPFADLLHLFKQGKSKPSVVTYHSDIIRQKYLKHVYSPLMHVFFNSVDAIVATSKNYVDTSKVLTKYKDKTHVIPIGLEESDFPMVTSTRLEYWREKLPNDFILFVGVLRYYKGLEYLLEAARHIKTPIVIAGDGPLFQQLSEEAQRLGLHHVTFVGYVNDEDKCALYQLATLLIVPASHRSEAFCITLVEGLFFGLPLISTEIGTGTSFVNEHNKTGLVISPRDPLAIQQAIEALLKDKERHVLMKAAAKARFNTYFSAQKMGMDYFNLYQSLC